jgi:hypothetical protein
MTRVDAKQEALLDELLKNYVAPQDILRAHGLLKHLTTRLVERALGYEVSGAQADLARGLGSPRYLTLCRPSAG